MYYKMYFKTQQNNCKCVLRFNVLFTFTSSCDWLSLIVLLCCGCWMGWLQLEAPEGPKRVSLDTEKQKETENKHKKTFGYNVMLFCVQQLVDVVAETATKEELLLH